ncbi:hypothetical protein HY449_00015 [Candidatus Pacearchaeota archaeon]|nr:hypothetical protein [Candidatus Pacearchaeota archaeon]
MKIGLDFDGVVSDCGQLKSDGAKKMYGLDIPPEKFKTEIVIGEGLLTLEQYKNLQKEIYGTRRLGLLMHPVEGIKEYSEKLRSDGDELKIITSRGKLESEIAMEWMKINGLNINLVGIGGGISKADACRGLDVYIDDDLDKLEPLVGIVPNLFLFSWGYNLYIRPEKIAKRINSWRHFYEEILKLSVT